MGAWYQEIAQSLDFWSQGSITFFPIEQLNNYPRRYQTPIAPPTFPSRPIASRSWHSLTRLDTWQNSGFTNRSKIPNRARHTTDRKLVVIQMLYKNLLMGVDIYGSGGTSTHLICFVDWHFLVICHFALVAHTCYFSWTSHSVHSNQSLEPTWRPWHQHQSEYLHISLSFNLSLLHLLLHQLQDSYSLDLSCCQC
jgi:hypothetical protein